MVGRSSLARLRSALWLVAPAFVADGPIGNHCFRGIFSDILGFDDKSFCRSNNSGRAGQEVISAGPYRVVRHPMYLGMCLMFLFTPLALGSYFALPAFALLIPLIVLRLLNEEKVLCQKLTGYTILFSNPLSACAVYLVNPVNEKCRHRERTYRHSDTTYRGLGDPSVAQVLQMHDFPNNEPARV